MQIFGQVAKLPAAEETSFLVEWNTPFRCYGYSLSEYIKSGNMTYIY